MKKRILALLLALTMAFSLLVFPASAAEVVASGNFNDSNGRYNLKWVLTDDGTMTISGSGYITSGLKEQWAEWGSMVSDARGFISSAPWAALAPGGAIFISVMVFNLLGDSVRDYTDPKMRRR